MWKKLTALSLSLLICLSMLPAQAGAMDAAENEPPVQSEDQISSEDADAGIAPCHEVPIPSPGPSGTDFGLGCWDSDGTGSPIGGGFAGLSRG